MAFALLSRLRYLVLKNNNFTVFPDVVRIVLILVSFIIVILILVTTSVDYYALVGDTGYQPQQDQTFAIPAWFSNQFTCRS